MFTDNLTSFGTAPYLKILFLRHRQHNASSLRQSVNAVPGNNRHFCWDSSETHAYTADKMQILMLMQTVQTLELVTLL